MPQVRSRLRRPQALRGQFLGVFYPDQRDVEFVELFGLNCRRGVGT